MNDDQIKHMADRFLGWHLPENFNPDAGISFARLSYLGRRGYAHRFMCELAKGDQPTPGHEAAHSCGRGDEGCVNPRHLSWKTKTQNALDCRQHGTQAKHHGGRYGKLTVEQVTEIRASDMKQCELAKLYGVHDTTISNIKTGRSRKNTNKDPRTGYLITEAEPESLFLVVGRAPE